MADIPRPSATEGSADQTAASAPRGGHVVHSRSAVAISLGFRMLVGAVVLAASVGIFLMLVHSAPTIEPSADSDGPPRLVVIEPRLVPVRREWSGFGTAEAVNRADVPARVTAIVAELPERVEEGRTVRAGELLVRLDDSDFVRTVESASAALGDTLAREQHLAVEEHAAGERVRLASRDLELAREDEGRVRRATEAEAAKVRELDLAVQRTIATEWTLVAAQEGLSGLAPRRAQLEAQRLGQESALRRAKEDVERCSIRSPIDGVLQSVDIKLGESVAVGTRVARVIGLDRIEIPLRLAASARREIAVGDPVTLFDDGRGERLWFAEVVRVAPQDDPSTRTTTVFAELRQSPEARDILTPGRFVQGSVASSVPTPRVIVPRRAVRADRVLVVHDGIVQSREVTIDFAVERAFPELGISDTLWLALRDPLPTGDLVVVDAGRSVVPGTEAVAVLPDGVEARADAARPTAEPAPR